MPYKLQSIQTDILKIEFIGDMTDEDVAQNSTDIDPYLENVSVEKPLNFLIDASRMGKMSAGTRRVFTERNKNPLVGSTAIYGLNRALKVLGHFIITASGRENIHFFDSETEALAWLERLSTPDGEKR